MIDGEPWFVAADVCRILGLTNPTVAIESLDEDEKRKIPESRVVVDPKLNLGSDSREVNIVNEPGLYRLIFSSRKTEARKFQRWIYHEVLPKLRKTGYFNLPNVSGFNLLSQAISELAAVERDKLAFDRHKFSLANSDESKSFAKAQLLRELASASGDERYVRLKLVRSSANLIMGDDFFPINPDDDDKYIYM